MSINTILVLLFIGLCAPFASAELSGLLGVLQYFGMGAPGNDTGSAQANRGQSHYSFESYALMRERHTCVPDDKYIKHLTELPQPRKMPIMIKCLQTEPPVNNNTLTLPKLHVMRSAKEIVNLLKPVGNATKRHEAGSCVVVHFCTNTSIECARVAPMINMLPHKFPTLSVAYIDAYEFTRFNAEFGIVSLPTLMIFHQGRPLLKFDPILYEGKLSLSTFITRHTNFKRVNPAKQHPASILQLLSMQPLSNVPTKTTDLYLGLAWAFILICLANYMRRTPLWKQIVEMVQRNWRESEETHMEMVD